MADQIITLIKENGIHYYAGPSAIDVLKGTFAAEKKRAMDALRKRISLKLFRSANQNPFAGRYTTWR